MSAVLAASWTTGTIGAGASQQVTIQFSPVAAQSYGGILTVNGDQTGGTNTIATSGTGTPPIQTGPRTSFSTGQYLVGSDIASGRYYSAPSSGCYWERESGLGGSLGEIIANDFIGFTARQWIVDILPSDKAFKTESACGTWFKDSPRQGAQTNITPGMWLVGSQITPGTYSVSAKAGCYWERLRDFTGNLSAIITNDFVASGGPTLVAISGSDLGFDADDECGTWTRTSAASTLEVDVIRSIGEIRRNRELAGRSRRPR